MKSRDARSMTLVDRAKQRMETDPSAALAAAVRRQHEAATYERHPSPSEADHEARQHALAQVARDARAVTTAYWLLDMHSLPPVPLDGDLAPAGDPLDTPDKIIDHWRANPTHGLGIATGKHPVRPWSYIAVEVDRFANFQDWITSASAVKEKVRDLGGFADLGDMPEVGPVQERTALRDPGAFTRIAWSPPPMPRMSIWRMDANGGKLADQMRSRTAGRGGWVLIVADDPDGKLNIRRGRKLAPGVTALPTGAVVPWEPTTVDGWSLTIQAPRHSGGGLSLTRGDPPRPWLIEALTR